MLTVDEAAAGRCRRRPAAAAAAPADKPRSDAAAPAAQAAPLAAAEHEDRRHRAAAGEATSAAAAPSKVVDISRGAAPRPAAGAGSAAGVEPPAAQVPAAPSTRRYARELGVDITSVEGSGPGGRVSMDDVKAHARSIITAAAVAARASQRRCPTSASGARSRCSRCAPSAASPPSGWRRRGRPCRTSRSATRPTSPSSRSSARSTRRRSEAAGGKLTITAIALKVIAAALKTFPQFNARSTSRGEAIVMKKYVHIGVAVDTDRGLLVPVIRDVDQQEHRAALGGARAVRREDQGRQAHARRDAGRVVHDQQPRRHRRHLLHADRQRAGSGDPRHVALGDRAGVERTSRSSRG